MYGSHMQSFAPDGRTDGRTGGGRARGLLCMHAWYSCTAMHQSVLCTLSRGGRYSRSLLSVCTLGLVVLMSGALATGGEADLAPNDAYLYEPTARDEKYVHLTSTTMLLSALAPATSQ